MKLAVALAVLPAAAAFVGPAAAPAETRLRETKADLEALAKELNPTVGFYDPLGLSSQNFWGKSEEETIGFLRHAEIKHGRVAMAAFSGYVVQANGFHWPWAMTMDGRSFDVAGSPPEQWDAIPLIGKVQIITFVGMLESYGELLPQHYTKGGVPGYSPPIKGARPEILLNLWDPFNFMARMTPEDIAAALVQAHRAKMPAPEELIANTPEAHEKAKAERHRPGFEDVTWFRIDIGRRQNAEPRWILPLICRRGHITRNEIGAIRIGQTESWFQVPRAGAGKFADAVQRPASPEDDDGSSAFTTASCFRPAAAISGCG